MTHEEILEIAADCNLKIYSDWYNPAIIGYTDNDKVVYSYNKMIECCMNNMECCEDDAIEWVNYNELGIEYMLDVVVVIHEVE